MDKKLLKYINYKDGFYIDCGANDGINQSTTWFYEKTLNTKSSKIIWLVDISIEEIAKKITSNFKITKEDFDPKLLNVTCVQNFSYGVIKI